MTDPTDVVKKIERLHDTVNRNTQHLSDPVRRKYATESNDTLRDIALRMYNERQDAYGDGIVQGMGTRQEALEQENARLQSALTATENREKVLIAEVERLQELVRGQGEP